MMEFPEHLAHYNRYLWQETNLIVVTGEAEKLWQGRAQYNTKHPIAAEAAGTALSVNRLLAAAGLAAVSLAEREFWDQYAESYEVMLSASSTDYAPWFIVPADYKWMARTFVAEVIISAIDGLKISYPKVSDEQIKQLMAAKKKLEAE